MTAERPPLWLAFCPWCGAAMSVGEAADAARCPKCARRIAYPNGDRFGASEWAADRRPEHLLGCLLIFSIRPGERKRRLAHAAVARRACGWCVEEWLRLSLAVAEGDAGHDHASAYAAVFGGRPPRVGTDTWDAWQLAQNMLAAAGPLVPSGLRPETRSQFADALRELFSNPFVPVGWNPDWFTPTVRDLARHIYDSHDFSAMPILADALQDTGCDDEQVLTHCRSGKPHARGCWVLDAVLGL